MGYDVSYHPISEEQIKEWYWDIDFLRILDDDFGQVEEIAKKYQLDDFYKDKYVDVMKHAIDVLPDESFEVSHGYFIAVIQGLFLKYFYTRGSAFSFLIDDDSFFEQYTKSWQEFSPYNYENPITNRIVQNYSSGVFIPKEKVVAILEDYHTNEEVKSKLDAFFSHNRIDIFLKALESAKELNAGLLEATEVVEPNPMDLNKSVCYSNLFNCDPEGALLYQEAVMEQFKEIEEKENLAPNTIINNAERTVIHQEPIDNNDTKNQAKPSFWKRLFG